MPAISTFTRLALVAAVSSAPAALHAQGNLSTQGLGYPPGQLSAAALGTGGALGEVDPASPLNPSNLLRWVGSNSLYANYAPEFRRITVGGEDGRTTVSRFPSIGAVVGLSNRFVMGLSSSTLLDRTFETRFTTTQVIGSDTIAAIEGLRSEGAMNDVRLAAAYGILPTLRVGLGLHVITGQNRFSFARTFPDTTLFGNVTQQDRIDFTGQAASIGAEWRAAEHLTLSASGRLGGGLRAKTAGDTVRAKGGVPDRFGGSISFNGISGTNLVVRGDWTGWSSLDDFVTSGTRARDAWDLSGGVETQGPRFANRIATLRVGARTRTLPFTAVGEQVDELTFAGGFAVPLAGDRATFDAAASRAARTAGDVRETGWTIGFGLTLRP